MNNVITAGLKTLETSSSVGMFARDTGGCLISRLAISRSSDESREISIAEITESSLFYFSAPFLAKKTAGLFAKAFNVDKDKLTTPIKEIKKSDNLKNIKLGKFAQIASVFSLILPSVFAIAPVRNYVTLGKTGKDSFTNVVELDKTNHNPKKEEAKEKTKKLCKILGAISAVSLGVSASIRALSRNKNFYKKIEPLIDKTIKHFEFTRSGDLEMKHYGFLIYPVSIASYFYASRDKYEVQENARRFSITVPLLFFGEKLIQNPIHKFADKTFKTNIYNNGKIKSYDDILKQATKIQKQELKAKNLAYGTTFFINTMAIAAGVALLNRYETQKHYQRDYKNLTKKPVLIPQKENEIWKDIKT